MKSPSDLPSARCFPCGTCWTHRQFQAVRLPRLKPRRAEPSRRVTPRQACITVSNLSLAPSAYHLSQIGFSLRLISEACTEADCSPRQAASAAPQASRPAASLMGCRNDWMILLMAFYQWLVEQKGSYEDRRKRRLNPRNDL